MCTMTWLRQDGGYAVFFNRDERRQRRPATPPRVSERNGVRYVAPADGDFGGSWIGANELGLTLCLLNGYEAGDDEATGAGGDWISRGLLLASLLDRDSGKSVERQLRGAALGRYRSFLLAWFVVDAPPGLATWRRERLSVELLDDARMPLISSSFETERVRRRRRELFTTLRTPQAGADGHFEFHRSHLPERGPYSVCMHRPDARTVSFSHVRVEPDRVRFHYVDHSPCRGRPEGPGIEIPRRAVRDSRGS